MKNHRILPIFLAALLGFSACDTEDELIEERLTN